MRIRIALAAAALAVPAVAGVASAAQGGNADPDQNGKCFGHQVRALAHTGQVSGLASNPATDTSKVVAGASRDCPRNQ